MPHLVKLNTNESPYGPSPKVLEAIRHAVSDGLQRYPDPDSTDLCAAIASHHGVDRDRVFVGNGSDEVLAFTFQALLDHGLPVLFPDISYSFYPVYCRLYSVPFETVEVKPDMSIDIRDFNRRNGGIIFPNPNAPTGRLLGLDHIATVADSHPNSVVVIDEAYVDFAGSPDSLRSIPSAISLTARYPNLLVIQTLSKSRGLAGLRIGFAIGHPDLIVALNRVKNSFNSYPLDRLAQIGGAAAIGDIDYFAQCRHDIMTTREQLNLGLSSLGFSVIPSSANFVFARHPDHEGKEIYLALRALGILVRHFSSARIAEYLRITVGTPDQCTALLSALPGVLTLVRDQRDRALR